MARFDKFLLVFWIVFVVCFKLCFLRIIAIVNVSPRNPADLDLPKGSSLGRGVNE